MEPKMKKLKNVLGGELRPCCFQPITGFYRDGYCRTGEEDIGTHVICAVMTEEFLHYTKSKGNDLSTPIPHFNFPGLKPGDQWCLCASRWKQAYLAGMAPEVVLEATHKKVLEFVQFDWLLEYKHTEV